jgi:hypothetical protein
MGDPSTEFDLASIAQGGSLISISANTMLTISMGDPSTEFDLASIAQGGSLISISANDNIFIVELSLDTSPRQAREEILANLSFNQLMHSWCIQASFMHIYYLYHSYSL